MILHYNRPIYICVCVFKKWLREMLMDVSTLYRHLGSFRWQKQVWKYSVLDENYNMLGLINFRVIAYMSDEQGNRVRTWDNFCCTSTLGEPSNWELKPKDHLLCAGSPLSRILRSVGATEGLFFPRGRSPSPDTRGIQGYKHLNIWLTLDHFYSDSLAE